MKNSANIQLDEEQKRAAERLHGTVVVSAPPGSGKTRVLTARFVNLVASGAPPSGVLAVTFTNRAAREMRDRVGAALGTPGTGLSIGTFHWFCLGFLKEHLGDFTLYGREDTLRVLKDMGVKGAPQAAELISTAKNTGRVDPETKEILAGYSARLAESGALDLDDLLLKTVEVLKSGAGHGFEHLMVDEFQDVNPVQMELTRLLSRSTKSVMVIGDPDQSIYGFRGASPVAFEEFASSGAFTVSLSTNYRSGSALVSSSMKVLSSPREINAPRTGGELWRVDCPDDHHEAEFIVKKVEELMGGLSSLTASNERGLRFSDFAVLVRTNAQVRVIEKAFEKSPIPYQVAGTGSDVMVQFAAHLRGLDGEEHPIEDLAPFVRREAREFGLSEREAHLVYGEARAYDLAAGDVSTPAEVLKGFADRLVLMTPADDFDIEADRVAVMTMHMAKGLEFPVVFVAGVEDGLVPLTLMDGTDPDEERRLLFVALTRARDSVYILSARRRPLWGSVRTPAPSPFLDGIPEGAFRSITVDRKKTRKRPVQEGLFD